MKSRKKKGKDPAAPKGTSIWLEPYTRERLYRLQGLLQAQRGEKVTMPLAVADAIEALLAEMEG